MSQALIELKNVTKTFQKKIALKDVNLKLYAHNVYGFSGPNGSGKTITFKSILGFVKVSKGTVIVNREVIRKDRLFARGIGFSIQEYGVLPNKSGRENLELLALLSPKKTGQIDDILTYVGLHPEDLRKVKDYSLGMKQRLLIAVALIGDDDILIFDEPTNALDEAGQAFMVDLIQDLQNKGKTILVSSHDSAFLKKVSNKIFYFNEGEIVNEVEI
jgi:ABC-2 type transport system ATP-binding protein